MKRLVFCMISFAISTVAFATLPDLSGTYKCDGWDAIAGKFKEAEDNLTLITTSKNNHEKIQRYAFTIKNYGDIKAQYTGFGTTTDGVHMAVYFANIDPKSSTDYGIAQLVFDIKQNTYSGVYYQPKFAEGNKTYDYGHVKCKKK